MFIINFTVGLKRYHFLYIVVFSLLFSFSILYASDKFDISGIGKNVNGYDTEYSFKIDFRNVENEISPILYGIFEGAILYFLKILILVQMVV